MTQRTMCDFNYDSKDYVLNYESKAVCVILLNICLDYDPKAKCVILWNIVLNYDSKAVCVILCILVFPIPLRTMGMCDLVMKMDRGYMYHLMNNDPAVTTYMLMLFKETPH